MHLKLLKNSTFVTPKLKINIFGGSSTRPALPQFKSEAGTFRLYFYRAITGHKLVEPLLNLTERQLKAVEYVKQHGSITNTKYQEIAQITKRTATRELKKLTDVNIFIQEGITGHGTKYKLKP